MSRMVDHLSTKKRILFNMKALRFLMAVPLAPPPPGLNGSWNFFFKLEKFFSLMAGPLTSPAFLWHVHYEMKLI